MNLTFLPDCATAKLSGPCNPDMVDVLDRALSYYEPGYRFTRLYQLHKWDGKTHLLNRADMTFPAGLALRVLEVFRERNWTLKRIDNQRPGPPWIGSNGIPAVPELCGVTLHPDQKAAVRRALEEQYGCLALSVGFGKTEVAAAIVKAAAPARCLFLVNKRTLLTQTVERFEERLGEPIGMIGAGYKNTRYRVTVATVQTLYQRFSRFTEFLAAQSVLIYDEAHTITPTTSFPILRAVPAPVRIGLSATIREASRRMAVEAYLGPILMESRELELIEAGRAAIPTVYMVNVSDPVAEVNDYPTAYDLGIVKAERRNRAICEAARVHIAQSLRVLILVVRLDHGYDLARALETDFLHGGTPLEVVSHAKREFEAGRRSVLIASTIFDFGQDIPSIQVLIMGGGGRSPLRTVQRTGRALRRKPGTDNTVRIIDFWDFSHRLLEAHSKEREKTYRQRGFPVERMSADWLALNNMQVPV